MGYFFTVVSDESMSFSEVVGVVLRPPMLTSTGRRGIVKESSVLETVWEPREASIASLWRVFDSMEKFSVRNSVD